MTDTNSRHASTTSANAHGDTGTTDTAELQADIERTREEIADTVDQLAAKLDVKTRVRDSVTEAIKTTKGVAAHQLESARDTATGPDGKPTRATLSVGGGIVAAVAAVVLVRLWLRSGNGGRRAKRLGH